MSTKKNLSGYWSLILRDHLYSPRFLKRYGQYPILCTLLVLVFNIDSLASLWAASSHPDDSTVKKSLMTKPYGMDKSMERSKL